MILCEAVHFDFGSRSVLGGASLQVARGELAALLGRNGSGKSTTLRLLGGLLAPRSGRIRVAGLDPGAPSPAFRRRVGLMPDGLGLFEELTVEEQLCLVGQLHGLGRADAEARTAALVAFLGLQDARWSRVRIASHGTRKKAALAITLIPDPEVLLLDEPFEGVDPAGVRRIAQLLRTLAARGRTILFSAHDLPLVLRMRPRAFLLCGDGTLSERPLDGIGWQDFEDPDSGQEVPAWLGSSCC